MDYIGIDISKKSFTVAFSSEKSSIVEDYENSPKGIRKFIKKLPQGAVVSWRQLVILTHY